MRINLQKVISIILILTSITLLGALFIFSPVCDGLLELKSGNMTHMKCFYTSKTLVVLSIILLLSGILAFFKKDSKWIVILIGILLIVTTFESIIGIGICKKDTMACHSTATWIRAGGIISIICGLIMIFKKK